MEAASVTKGGDEASPDAGVDMATDYRDVGEAAMRVGGCFGRHGQAAIGSDDAAFAWIQSVAACAAAAARKIARRSFSSTFNQLAT